MDESVRNENESVDDVMARWVTEDECTICCSTLKESDVLVIPASCQHKYHSDCIITWLKTRAECPMCRALIRPLLQDDDDEADKVVDNSQNEAT